MIYKFHKLDSEEERVIGMIEKTRESLRWVTHDAARWEGLLRRSLFARAIRASNSIEGHNVSLDDVIAAAADGEPLSASEEDWQATIGYRNAMTYILQLAKDPYFTYSEGLIRSLHFMILRYSLAKHPGLWRPGVIYVRDERIGEIVYEGPSADIVPSLMNELISSLNETSNMPALVRAAMAHLNLAMIHPFSDGNGRMARCMQTLVLARGGILAPEFCSIEEYLGNYTDDYYKILARVGKGKWNPKNDARPWIRFSLKAHYHQAQKVLHRAKESSNVWQELEELKTKHNLEERNLFALYDATFGFRVRNSTYRAAAEISINLASRDLKELSDKGLLVPSGQGGGRYYTLSKILEKIRKKTREEDKLQDPFSDDIPEISAVRFPTQPATLQQTYDPTSSPWVNTGTISSSAITVSAATPKNVTINPKE